MKKAFTLVEMMMVILIIGILFGILGYMSWSYIHQLNIQNDRETVENAFSFSQTSTLSQPNFGTKFHNLSYLGIKLTPGKTYLTYVGLTGNNRTDVDSIFSLKADPFYYISVGSGFKIFEGSTQIENLSGDAYFWYKPYSIGSSFSINSNGTFYIYTGNHSVEFSIQDKSNNSNYTKCMKFDISSGRLYNVKCS